MVILGSRWNQVGDPLYLWCVISKRIIRNKYLPFPLLFSGFWCRQFASPCVPPHCHPPFPPDAQSNMSTPSWAGSSKSISQNKPLFLHKLIISGILLRYCKADYMWTVFISAHHPWYVASKTERDIMLNVWFIIFWNSSKKLFCRNKQVEWNDF